MRSTPARAWRIVCLAGIAAACSGQPPAPAESPPAAPVAAAAPIARDPAPPVAAPAPKGTTWTAMEIAPGCAVRIADDPAALGSPLEWRPCADGPAGCREAPTRSAADALAPSVAVQGLAHGGEVTIAVITSLPGPTARYALAPLDGPPFLAIEGPRDERCSLGGIGLTDDGAVIEIAFDFAEGYASRAYLRGPLRADPAWRRVAAVLPRADFPEFIGESAFSVGGRVVVEQNGGPLRWFDAGARRWVEVPGSHTGWECCASGHGDAVAFLIESIPERVLAARLGEPARPLRDGAASGTSPLAIDGARAVWLEGRGRDRNNVYARIELWAGDVAPGPALANAAPVAALPLRTMAAPVFGGGVAAVPLGEPGGGLAIVRVDGPDLRVLTPPAGLTIERLLWVASDEVAVQIGPGGAHVDPSLLRRIPIASLPPLRLAR